VRARAWPGRRDERATLQRAREERGKEGRRRKEKKENGKRKIKKEKERERKRERERERAHAGGIRGRRSRVGDRQPSGAERDGGNL
jgi:hypothetical protein